MIIITHGKINGRATVNLKISILDSRINHSSRLKKAKWQKEKTKTKTKKNKRAKEEKNTYIYINYYLW